MRVDLVDVPLTRSRRLMSLQRSAPMTDGGSASRARMTPSLAPEMELDLMDVRLGVALHRGSNRLATAAMRDLSAVKRPLRLMSSQRSAPTTDVVLLHELA